MVDLIFTAGTFVFLIALGLFVGGATERRHLRALSQREAALAGIRISQLRSFPDHAGELEPTLLCAEVVISSDYLKTFLGNLRKIFGGELRSFQTLMERARREVQLRLQEEAQRRGYNAICNLRLETVDLAGRERKNALTLATLLASATAYQARPSRPGSHHDASVS